MAATNTVLRECIGIIMLIHVLCCEAGIRNKPLQLERNNISPYQNPPRKYSKLSENEIDPNVSPVYPESNITDPNITDPLVTFEDSKPVNIDDVNPINKFCKCSETLCDCCRDFRLPLIPVRGPACAKIRYLDRDRMSVVIKYGDITLATRKISGNNTQPICMPFPAGLSQFCVRIYGLSKGKDDFKACLGLELRAETDVEASLRVSCFKFGSKGLTVVDAEPLPLSDEKNDNDEDDDDDDDDDPDDEDDDDDDDSFLDFGGDDQ